MTYLAAYKQAAFLDGDSPEEMERSFERIILRGGLPPNAHEEIPPGDEDAVIARALAAKRELTALRQMPAGRAMDDYFRSVESARNQKN
jgi:hypothetical protein